MQCRSNRFTTSRRARPLFGLIFGIVATATIVTAQSSGTFASASNMTTARSLHSATLLPNGQVLIAGGASTSSGILASAEIYDPDAVTFRSVGTMTAARRMHTATLLPDDTVLIVGGYGEGGALASAELFDPVTATFRATDNLSTARGGHTAILLPTGKVLVIGGYGVGTYPDVAPAELYDPASRTFTAAGAYIGRGGCDFCAPSILLGDGTVLFPGQYPAQLYDPKSDSFSPSGMSISDLSEAVALTNGKVLFAGGEDLGRSSSAELYDPGRIRLRRYGNMAWRRVWHTLNWLPNGMVLAAGGETDSCSGNSCFFAGTIASAELYDPLTGTFVVDRQHGGNALDAHRDASQRRPRVSGWRCLVWRHRHFSRKSRERGALHPRRVGAGTCACFCIWRWPRARRDLPCWHHSPRGTRGSRRGRREPRYLLQRPWY